MSTKEKWIVYGIGFLLGCIFLSVIQRIKSAAKEKSPSAIPQQIEKAVPESGPP